jgi:hypothetical protein
MKTVLKCIAFLTASLGVASSAQAMIAYAPVYPSQQMEYIPAESAYAFPQIPMSFTLDSANSQIQVGTTFDVDLVVHNLFANTSANERLLAFGLNVVSSISGLLEYQGSSINPLFSDDSLLLGLHAAGSAFPGLSSPPPLTMTISLATLHFKALATGQTSLSIDSNLLDFNQGLFFLNQGQVAISAQRSFDITAVPLPPSLLIFVSGVAVSFGGIRRKRG